MPAPKGNKYALGGPGNCKVYDSPQKLQADIDAYFKKEDENPITIWHNSLTKDGQPVKIEVKRPYTIEGLAIHLGLTRQTLLNYQKTMGYEEFFNTIIRAKEIIRKSWIDNALVGAYKERFAEFVLANNSDYVNASKIDHSSNDGTMSPRPTIEVHNQNTADKLNELYTKK